MRHTLNLIHNDYRSILVRTIDTDVLNLLISHISQVELDDDVNIHVHELIQVYLEKESLQNGGTQLKKTNSITF